MTLASLCTWAVWFESYLVPTPKDRFSREEALIFLVFGFLSCLKSWEDVEFDSIDSWSLPLNEPRHDKTNKMSVRPAKTQISLGIRLVWSESSLCAPWVAKDPSILHADSKDSDQIGRMPRLIWVFAGRTVTLLVLSWGSSNLLSTCYTWEAVVSEPTRATSPFTAASFLEGDPSCSKKELNGMLTFHA